MRRRSGDPEPRVSSPDAGERGGGQARDPDAAGDTDETTYADVIEGAESDNGLFNVHHKDDDYLFEIPDSLLGRDMLLVSRISGKMDGLGGFAPAGVATNRQMLRFERRGDRILLRKYSGEAVADDTLAIAASVEANYFAPILASWDIEARGADSTSSVIDVTDFFEGDTPAISGLSSAQRRTYQVRRLDGDRSFIGRVRSYPLNVNVRHTLTYDAGAPPSNARANTVSLEMNQSLVLLPTEPMRPRYADARVGFFSINRINYGLDEQKAATETFIRRWRLEPSDPVAYARGEVVDPVQPITYYLDPATPERYVGAVRRGIENWQAAFETAGFSNAIVALEAPTREEDPDWDPEDVRYSVARWSASETRNAQGPSTSDPRTGEIIESGHRLVPQHMRSYRNWMMVQTGAANPDARQLPLTDQLMEEAMEQVITHEIGHAIGLPHNMVASSSYRLIHCVRRPSPAAWASLRRSWTMRARTISHSRRTACGRRTSAADRRLRPLCGELGVQGAARCRNPSRRDPDPQPLDRRARGRPHVQVFAARRTRGERSACTNRGHGRRPRACKRIRDDKPEAHRPEPGRVDDQARRGLHGPRRDLRRSDRPMVTLHRACAYPGGRGARRPQDRGPGRGRL